MYVKRTVDGKYVIIFMKVAPDVWNPQVKAPPPQRGLSGLGGTLTGTRGLPCRVYVKYM